MKLKKIKTKILDCTLRDGSYVNNFSFSYKDTYEICRGLEEAGLKYIEIGHGLGLGASKFTKFQAKENDLQYLKAARNALKKAQWGMFCIPSFSCLDDLKIAADYGMKFIRIGTDMEDYKTSEKFVSLAKKLGLFVCSNFMKTYLVSPKKFIKYVKYSNNIGSDLIYIVDSAGGMFPEEINLYHQEIKKNKINIKLGFHGHNNLGLAVQNTLEAIKLNFELVDCSLQGLGRSSGNACLEQVVCSLIRKGINIEIDPLKIMNLAEKKIQKWLSKKGYGSIDVLSGMTLFHSSYMPFIKSAAKKYKVDARELIIAVTNLDRSTLTKETSIKEAIKLSKKNKITENWKKIWGNYYGQEQL